jgi:hypothetical protein
MEVSLAFELLGNKSLAWVVFSATHESIQTYVSMLSH